jgi:predicted acylesterase/phospholipase RssA
MGPGVGLSFSGGGHLLCYSLGVAQTLIRQGYGAHFCGASGGAVVAAVCACLPGERERTEFLTHFASRCRSLSGLHALLPDDAATLATGRCFVGLTECETGSPMQVVCLQ